jgi:hypothetical protein
VGLFLLPAAVIGVPAQVIAIIAPIQLFAQFWYHTRLINKMGFLEKIIVTPSHHRVHHAINPEYIDKNYGQIFIVWDKWFGSFQPELKEVTPVYGVKRPVHTWNPLLIGVQHVWLIIKDAFRTKRLRDKLRIWFMPTGWRPDDVKEKYPVAIIDDVYHLNKYDTQLSSPLLLWSWLQLWILLGLTFYLFLNFAEIGFPMVLIYGLFLFISIFSLTATLDRANYALHAEWIRTLFGLWLIYQQGGDWFGIIQYGQVPIILMSGYLIIAAALAFYFSKTGELKSSVLANDR